MPLVAPADRGANGVSQSAEVVGKVAHGPGVVELRLRPLGGGIDHRPGQYLLVHGPDATTRPYTICNAPRGDGELSLLVSRATGGALSGWVHEGVRQGDRIRVTGPRGARAPELSRRCPTLCLAGGSGLAPILALADAALAAGHAEPLTVLLSVRTERHVLAGGTLADWSLRYPNFRTLTTLTRAWAAGRLHGRVPAILPRVAPDLSGHDVVVAGPQGFVTACRAAARASGAPADRVVAVGG